MKINICLMFCLFIKYICGYDSRRKNKKSAELIAPRFSELSNLIKMHNRTPYNFKVIINVIKESDPAGTKPKDIKTVVNLTKEGINLMKKKQVVKKVAYKE